MISIGRRIAAGLLALSCATPAVADDKVPQFQVEASWPKPLPNNWILGQVSGIATDKYDRIWVVHRPASLTPRERAAEQNPPEAKCCVAAPPVLVFDTSATPPSGSARLPTSRSMSPPKKCSRPMAMPI